MASAIERMLAESQGIISSDIQNTMDNYGLVPVDSSWIEVVSYNEAIRAMRVQLQDGSSYTYYNIPPNVYDQVISSGSPGRVINKIVKMGFYPFTRG